MIAESLGVKYATLIGGFLGALVSLKFIEGMSVWSRASTVLAGALVAAYLTPVVVEWMELSAKMEGGIAFLVGLFGMSMAGAVIKAAPEFVDAAKKKLLG